MEVRKFPEIRSAMGPLHGPYWLWSANGNRPLGVRPEGEVKINFDYNGYLASPVAVTVALLDEAAETFLEGFDGGDLLFASNLYERAFLFERVPRAVRRSPKRFAIIVREYVPLRPIPDAFEWPLPEPPPPTEEELEEARRRELSRQQQILMTDPGIAAVRYNRNGRRVRRSGSTRSTR